MTSRVESVAVGHAAAAAALVRRAIESTAGREYSPDEVEVWLRGMADERFEAMLSDPATVALGAYEADVLVGFATFVAAEGRLDFLYVDPAARRRGVARRLVEAVEEHARAAGCRSVRVDASRLARPALVRMGYAVVGDNRKHVAGVTFDNVWLEKRV